MPWKETYAMKERLKLVSLYETGRYTVTELAQHFGVSRKTVHKWLERFAEEGVSGLDGRSRAPHRSPRDTPTPVVLAVLRAKEVHPTWGSCQAPAYPRGGPWDCQSVAGSEHPRADPRLAWDGDPTP